MQGDFQWASVEREIDAPIDQVWRLWTEAELFKNWYGPNGATVPTAELDVVVGGTRRVEMQMKMPDRTMTMYFTGAFKEVAAPHRLVYTEAMCDADGNVLPPASMGMPEGTPEETEVIVELTDLGGRTRIKLVHVGVPSGSPGEGGWAQAIEKLSSLASSGTV